MIVNAQESALPTVGVVMSTSSISSLDIFTQADGLAEIVLIFDSQDSGIADLVQMMQSFTAVELVDSEDLPPSIKRLDDLNLDGITTFAEDKILLTSHLAEGLGLGYHAPNTAKALASKAIQRETLSSSGLGVAHGVARNETEVLRLLRDLGGECVIKPISGSGSRNTFKISLDAADHEFPADGFPAIVEQYIPDGYHPASAELADYVSVETVFMDGVPVTFSVTDKLPLLPPFRETGGYFPSILPVEDKAEVVEVAERGLQALGVKHGVTHTEVKLSSLGPVIIEINGRLGGGIDELSRLSSGNSGVRFVLQSALGGRFDIPDSDRSAGLIFVAPPGWASSYRSPFPTARLKKDFGVDSVQVKVSPGEPLDYRAGLTSCVAFLWLTTPSLVDFLRTRETILDFLHSTLDWQE